MPKKNRRRGGGGGGRNLRIFDDDEDDPLDGRGGDDYPEWSWDRVRPWVAIRRADKYSDDQIRSLASQDVVMLEKMNGYVTYGSVEEGTLHAAQRIKALNPKVKILFYLNAMIHYGKYAANDTFDEGWAMRNPETGENFKWRNRFLGYDHTNSEFREWWIGRGLDMVGHDEIDGIFIDALCQVDRDFLPVKNHGEAYLVTANKLRARLPEGKILIGNALRAEYLLRGITNDGGLRHLRYLDGSYLENWIGTTERVKLTLDLMSVAIQAGRMIMLKAEPDGMDKEHLNELETEKERYAYAGRSDFINFSLGVFLLVVGRNCYFSYRTGVDALPGKGTLFDNTRFAAITRELGEPKGHYAREGGHVYTREFERLRVRVNLKTMEGQLAAKGGGGGEEL